MPLPIKKRITSDIPLSNIDFMPVKSWHKTAYGSTFAYESDSHSLGNTSFAFTYAGRLAFAFGHSSIMRSRLNTTLTGSNFCLGGPLRPECTQPDLDIFVDDKKPHKVPSRQTVAASTWQAADIGYYCSSGLADAQHSVVVRQASSGTISLSAVTYDQVSLIFPVATCNSLQTPKLDFTEHEQSSRCIPRHFPDGLFPCTTVYRLYHTRHNRVLPAPTSICHQTTSKPLPTSLR